MNLKNYFNEAVSYLLSQKNKTYKEYCKFWISNKYKKYWNQIKNKEYNEAMLCASKAGYFEIVKLMLNKDTRDKTSLDCYHKTLIYATNYGYNNIIKLLLNYCINNKIFMNEQELLKSIKFDANDIEVIKFKQAYNLLIFCLDTSNM